MNERRAAAGHPSIMPELLPTAAASRPLQDEAGLTHFCWAERDAASGNPVSGDPELDIVIIPGECNFSKVRARPACLLGSRHDVSILVAAIAKPARVLRTKPCGPCAHLRACTLLNCGAGPMQISRPGARIFELRFPEEKHRNMFFWAQASFHTSAFSPAVTL